MILLGALICTGVGAAAGVVATLAWIHGALEDERRRGERIERDALRLRRERDQARRRLADDPTEQLLADVRTGLGRHRKAGGRR